MDNEVRDRAALYLKAFKEEPLAAVYVKEDSIFSLAVLESKLVSYVNDLSAATKAFDTSSVPKISRAQAAQEVARPTTLDTIGVPASSKKTSASPPPPTAAETQSAYLQQLAEVPELESFGPVLNSSSKPVQLTENETEYQVTCVKHIFKEHIVFQVRSFIIGKMSILTMYILSSMYRILFQTRFWSKSRYTCSPVLTPA